MARAATLAVFLLCCCFFRASTGSRDGCDLYAATSKSITVSLTYALKESDNLRWLKDQTTIFNRKNKKVIQGKPEDVDSSGSLKLTQLTKDKAGTYNAMVYNEDGKNVGSSPLKKLCVLDPVQKPKVTMKCDNSKKEVIFTCIVGQNVKIKWFMDDKNLSETENTLKRAASKVVNSRFVCEAYNPISSKVSEPVQQTCYQPSFPEELWGISIWVFVGGGAGVVLVLILIVIICCIQTKRKRRMRLKDEGELRLQWTNQERQQQQHHHHHHHHHQQQHQHQNHPDQHEHPHHYQQQPAGNTGPRQPRAKQQRAQQRPRAPEPPNGHPQPSPRRAAQASKPADNSNEEQPPPLPQPRKKKAPKE